MIIDYSAFLSNVQLCLILLHVSKVIFPEASIPSKIRYKCEYREDGKFTHIFLKHKSNVPKISSELHKTGTCVDEILRHEVDLAVLG